MRLSIQEFRAMNTAVRRFLQRAVEFPLFRQMGLGPAPGDLLEIGCGSGYGATLLLTLGPRSYTGIDLMPEQIALAQQRRLPQARFMLQDASDLAPFGDASLDTVVIFGVLHHIPAWRPVVRECFRVLRPGGRLFVEEPGAEVLGPWERIFHWGHPASALFTLKTLEAWLEDCGFRLVARRRWLGFGSYAAQRS